MNKVTLLNEKDKQAVINELRIFLQRKGVDQKDFAKMVGKNGTTVSRWMSGKYPITKNNADAIRFIIGFTPEKKAGQLTPDNFQFLQFKAKMLNFIMQHPAISEKSKVEVYNALQDFQLASPTSVPTPVNCMDQ